MSTLSTVAMYPQKIRRLFKPQHIAPDGKYTISLWDIRGGKWQDVEIDDKIPCVVRGSQLFPLFCRPIGEEIWMMLIEKAIAKFCHSYGNLSFGNPAWAFQVLTGQEKILRYEKHGEGFMCKQLGKEKQIELGPRNPRIVWWAWLVAPGIPNLDMWDKMKRHMASDHLAVCFNSNTGGASTTPHGIANQHAYSVLAAKEAKRKNGDTVRLVKLRNPWAHDAFHGQWGPHSPIWKEEPDVKRQIQDDVKDDGEFWMCWHDWCIDFGFIDVCPKDMDPDHGPEELFTHGELGRQFG
jgi:calpain-15